MIRPPGQGPTNSDDATPECGCASNSILSQEKQNTCAAWNGFLTALFPDQRRSRSRAIKMDISCLRSSMAYHASKTFVQSWQNTINRDTQLRYLSSTSVYVTTHAPKSDSALHYQPAQLKVCRDPLSCAKDATGDLAHNRHSNFSKSLIYAKGMGNFAQFRLVQWPLDRTIT